MADGKRRLLLGMALFLIGLLTGLVEQHFANVRMALARPFGGRDERHVSAGGRRHLERGQTIAAHEDGSLLDAAHWNVRQLDRNDVGCCSWTAALSPITAVGHEAEPWKEAMITAGFVFIGLAIILAVVLLMLGLRSTAEPQ